MIAKLNKMTKRKRVTGASQTQPVAPPCGCTSKSFNAVALFESLFCFLSVAIYCSSNVLHTFHTICTVSSYVHGQALTICSYAYSMHC